MTRDEARSHIEEALNRILTRKGLDAVQITDQMGFFGGDIPIDSLDLAVLLTDLEQTTNRDPFKDGFINFNTVGELANLYADQG